MTKSSFAEMPCSLGQALDVIGEWWSMLIIRDLMVFGGSRRFEQLREGLGISRNILTERLRKLEEADVIRRQPVTEGARRQAYQLTAKGWELMPVMLAMVQWSERWRPDPESIQLRFVDRRDERPLAPIAVYSHDGRSLGPDDIEPLPNTPEASLYLEKYAS
ncbi:MAG TPA: helix-turn-helix domain-containing protein [Spongiibacteraceae bacterium]|jgi:DNA-binding HxlR family transcriptional regulator|nr:helix-turn-helix domain-containing protein [Spongiibacteraceae bacterium]HUH38139.1 helix-turn-helix domain-containing protein [Spongiibacteraceae bacterium]